MSKIVLQGHIVVPLHDLSAVIAELPRHIELSRQEQGCLIFQVTQDAYKKTLFTVYEEFADRDAFQAHQQRVKGSHWGRITSAVERHYHIQELE